MLHFLLFMKSIFQLFKNIRPNIEKSMDFDAKLFRNFIFDGMKTNNKYSKV